MNDDVKVSFFYHGLLRPYVQIMYPEKKK